MTYVQGNKKCRKAFLPSTEVSVLWTKASMKQAASFHQLPPLPLERLHQVKGNYKSRMIFNVPLASHARPMPDSQKALNLPENSVLPQLSAVTFFDNCIVFVVFSCYRRLPRIFWWLGSSATYFIRMREAGSGTTSDLSHQRKAELGACRDRRPNRGELEIWKQWLC